VARALFKHGRLDRGQIANILRDLPTSITLNQAGADYASDLIAAGKVNWGPFTWDDETDGADLLDEEGEDAVSYYHLGYDTEVVGSAKYHFPFGKDGEIYVKALLEAEKQGGPVGSYAAKLLDEITAMKKQSAKNTGRIASRGYYGDGETVYWRTDGFIRPL
jgi:hypothetical protein